MGYYGSYFGNFKKLYYWEQLLCTYCFHSYELVDSSNKFELQSSTSSGGGTSLKLKIRGELNREVEPSYSLNVLAKEGGAPANTGM